MNSRFVQQAIQKARLSDHKQKVGCVIFNKKQIMSLGYNQSQRSVKKLHPKFQRWLGSVHAEVDAIIKAKKELKGSTILVVRVNNQGEFRLAKPCPHCMKYIYVVGIRKIIYSIETPPFFEQISLKG